MSVLLLTNFPFCLPEVSADGPVCLSIGSDYSYSFPKTNTITGDISMTNLNNGVLETKTPGTTGWTTIRVTNESQAR